MSEKKSFILRIDAKKFRALEKWAADEFRSTNGHIEFILEEALRKAGRYSGKRDEVKERGDSATD